MLTRLPATIALSLGAALASSAAQVDTSHELPGVEVSRVVVEARVLDDHGRAMPALEAKDFRLEVDGRSQPLDAAVWIPDGVDQSEAPSPAELPREVRLDAAGRIPGRLVTLLFQKDHRGSRLEGLLRMIARSSELLDQFGPRDQVAILVFDTHLRLHLDFTGDRQLIERTLSGSIMDEWPEPLRPGPPPSLAARLAPSRLRLATTPEKALLLLAEALQGIHGDNVLLVFGWGMGQTVGGIVTLSADYGRARQILNRSRVSVFSIDIVDADYHTLEHTLERVATDTGGLYVKTVDHPGLALSRLAEALSGHYVLSFERPEGPRGAHSFEITLADRSGTILSRRRYAD